MKRDFFEEMGMFNVTRFGSCMGVDEQQICNYCMDKSKAIIVPHAGVYYSGYAAMSAFQRLELSETIFIIAPSHHDNFNNIALPEYTYFDTPLGSLEVNTKIINDISSKFPCITSDEISNVYQTLNL